MDTSSAFLHFHFPLLKMDERKCNWWRRKLREAAWWVLDLKLISGCVFTDLPLGDINTGIVIVATGKVADRWTIWALSNDLSRGAQRSAELSVAEAGEEGVSCRQTGLVRDATGRFEDWWPLHNFIGPIQQRTGRVRAQ